MNSINLILGIFSREASRQCRYLIGSTTAGLTGPRYVARVERKGEKKK